MNFKIITGGILLLFIVLAGGGIHFFTSTGRAGCEQPYIEQIRQSSLALKKDEKNAETYLQRANAYYKLGWYYPAGEDYSSAIDCGREDGELFLRRSKCHYMNEDYQLAIHDALRAKELKPDNPDCWHRLGDIQRKLRDYEQARASYLEGLTLDSGNVPLHTCLARLYENQENLAKAEYSYNTAIDCDGDHIYTHYRRGILFARQHKYKKALADFTQVIEATPTCYSRRLLSNTYLRRMYTAQAAGLGGYRLDSLKAFKVRMELNAVDRAVQSAQRGRTGQTADLMLIYLPLTMLLMTGFFLITGALVVVHKRPLVISARWFFSLICVAFSTQLVNSARMLITSESGALSFALWINPLIFALLLLFLWLQMRGYMLIGIRDDSFREALHNALHRNNLAFEEQLSRLMLTEEHVELQIAIQPWIGAGQVKVKPAGQRKLLRTVVTDIDAYYRSNSVVPNLITPVFYLLIGILMLVSTGAVTFVLLN